MKVCQIPGCEEKYACKGYCMRHYNKWRHNGDPLYERQTWLESFWARIEVTGFCWNWTGYVKPNGYGSTTIKSKGTKRTTYVHRVAYELLVGPIAEGLHLDHLCRNRLCVNPDHLDPVTPKVNLLRGFGPTRTNAEKTHCKRGHEFTPENTYHPPRYPDRRSCRECMRMYAMKYYWQRKAAAEERAAA